MQTIYPKLIKYIISFSIGLFVVQNSFSQFKDVHKEDLYCRSAIKYENNIFVLAIKNKLGYLLKYDKNLVADTLAKLQGDNILIGDHKICVTPEKIYIVLTVLNDLVINDSILFHEKKVNNIICFNHNGKFLWRNYFKNADNETLDFNIASGKGNNIYLGYDTKSFSIFGNDTVGQKSRYPKIFILKLNKKGEYSKIKSLPNNNGSSILYELIKYKRKPLAITIRKKKRTPAYIEIQKAGNKKTYFKFDSLQIFNATYSKPYILVLTHEDYIFKIHGKKVKSYIKIKNNLPIGKTDGVKLEEKSFYDSGSTITSVNVYWLKNNKHMNKTDKSFKNFLIAINWIDKKSMKTIDEQIITTTAQSRIQVLSCSKDEILANVDAKLKLISIKNN